MATADTKRITKQPLYHRVLNQFGEPVTKSPCCRQRYNCDTYPHTDSVCRASVRKAVVGRTPSPKGCHTGLGMECRGRPVPRPTWIRLIQLGSDTSHTEERQGARRIPPVPKAGDP